jgi:tRNA threonylcarbamoyladenosine biosynthesis protein TsaB
VFSPYPLLALDTSGAPAVAVLTGPDDPPVVRAADDDRAHAELLAPLVQSALGEAGLAVADLAGIAVGTGPAPYTGLRIGLVTARALAYPGRPVWGVPSLDALAASAAAQLTPAPGTTILATGDAKRREVYWALYRVETPGPAGAPPELTTITPPSVGAPGTLPDADIITGGGAARYPDQLPATEGGPERVDPAMLGRLAARRALAGRPTPAEPLYLRRPDATPPGPRKRATIVTVSEGDK